MKLAEAHPNDLWGQNARERSRIEADAARETERRLPKVVSVVSAGRCSICQSVNIELGQCMVCGSRVRHG